MDSSVLPSFRNFTPLCTRRFIGAWEGSRTDRRNSWTTSDCESLPSISLLRIFNLRECPLDLARLFGTIIMRTSYGFDDIGRNESLIKSAEHVVEEVGESIKPTKFLVNVFPAMQYVPAWFPGAGWKRHLNWVAGVSENTRRQPFEDAKESTVRGLTSPHFVWVGTRGPLTPLPE